MPLSFEDEIRGLLKHNAEQNPSIHKLTTEGSANAGIQESLEFFADIIASHGQALIRIAREIDNLRPTI
jgi:hypothetical protein